MTKGHSIEGALDAVLTRLGAVPFLVLVALVLLLPGFFTLPPMDRDEPRFAQASKQMLETSDFVAIRFGDEARNKKPVGIHWLQAAMGALVRVYLADEATRRRLFGNAIVFWAALGIGILIKGPINPLIPSLAAVVLSLRQRSAQWLRGLRPLPGLVLCLLVVLPWFVLILLKTNGSFFTDAVGHDFLGKVAGGQEMHGAPPGFYLATFWLTAWPFAPSCSWRSRACGGTGATRRWASFSHGASRSG